MNTEDAQQKIEQAKELVISSISETMDLYGVSSSAGRLYGVLYFQGNPLSLDDMKDELGMSKPSMSSAVKKLQENEMVQKTWKKGTRRDMYVAEKDFFKSFSNFFCKKWEKEVVVNLKATYKALEILEPLLNDNEEIDETTKEEATTYYYQIKESQLYYEWLQQLVEGFKSGKIYDCFPKT
ncbi:choline uptake/conversion transcriptional regulator CudC [Salirhabdus salicampi]|uniref:choline uptake/conversion transcriptional regulator CudC n=1 Tax=Salirhabdus salicampi TaxID=476102 RepID=UPI0020C23FBA|nr:GbsR/MarR family transcriptional regulator [Salirhabdus salicampi]MCP8615714.1 GbsR/MarR family transcriptional regulator [Salirhabdus salicampi]